MQDVGGDALGDELDRRLSGWDRELAEKYPGDRGVRQPVHTVYVPGDRFVPETARLWGLEALRMLGRHDLPDVPGLDAAAAAEIRHRVEVKLAIEPIEDLRIDFEDGYGRRPDAVEDADVRAAARALAISVRGNAGAPFHGLRFKSFEASTRRRGLRTLRLFLGTLIENDGLAPGFVVTLPKVTAPVQVEAMAATCAALEREFGLPSGRLGFEIQIETPQAITGPDGAAAVARMIHAAAGRCTGLHYGTYDYSAGLGIAAAYQSLEHPAADHAKAVMQVAAAGTGVHLSDGSTNVVPVGNQVGSAWTLHARLVRRSLERGYYQGWDLHPAQLPTRYLATYAFFRAGLPQAVARLRAYLHGGDSGFLDEPATAAALAGFVRRGLDCGALDAGDLDGLDPARLAELSRRAPAAQ
ncbi:aldolase [Nocardia panacis]|uniref:Aldolase n=1 Tax=Nocardia panacis TaxID=2340916 RepID=A0A3A4K8S8_9NOCA|nr:aldolase/citrate lyase family protein [Nocardia panacis]RJO75634.1 aldolase [Nocardia panacis]